MDSCKLHFENGESLERLKQLCAPPTSYLAREWLLAVQYRKEAMYHPSCVVYCRPVSDDMRFQVNNVLGNFVTVHNNSAGAVGSARFVLGVQEAPSQ